MAADDRTTDLDSAEGAGRVRRVFARLVDVRPDEVGLMLVAMLYFFLVLCSYYMLRPIRDEISTTTSTGSLTILWTIVSCVMLILAPLYMTLVGWKARGQFIPWVYRFFALNLLVIAILLAIWSRDEGVNSPSALVWLERIFYVWTSVFNLFVVSVFWAFMADFFRVEQAKRLFGFIAVGGTFGALVGAAVTGLLINPPTSILGWDTSGLASLATPKWGILIFAAVLLEGACWCVYLLNRMGRARQQVLTGSDAGKLESGRVPKIDAPIGGTVMTGLAAVFRSPYLLGICGYIFLYSLASTVLYYAQREIVGEAFEKREERIAFFAGVEVLVQSLTILIQIFLTGRILRWVGLGLALAALPFISMLGFASLSMLPVLWTIVIFQVARRAGNYALAKPAREVLFTVVPREEKFKAKTFIDTAVYRWSDSLSGWFYLGLEWLGAGLSVISITLIPLAGVWLAIGLLLGKQQKKPHF